MSYRRTVVSLSVLATVAFGMFLSYSITAQTGEGGGGESNPGAAWAVSHLPWGDPDLQGIWDGGSMTPLERPDKYADREFLTDEEIEALETAANANPGRNARAEQGSHEDVEGAYNDVFTARRTNYARTNRSALIIDPPDGRIPFTAAMRAEAARAADARARSSRRGDGLPYFVDTPDVEADNPEDRGKQDRCLGVTLPSDRHPIMRLVQSPDVVAIYYEFGPWGGAYRAIYLDGRPHTPSGPKQHFGHSVGRWEGDTLVVDTRNFSNESSYHGSSENLHLIERFTRVADVLIHHHITVEDATVFTRPWTQEVPLVLQSNKENLIFESGCHEGNYSLTSILAGARRLEKE